MKKIVTQQQQLLVTKTENEFVKKVKTENFSLENKYLIIEGIRKS